MSKKEVDFCNRDRFIELGLMIASLRKMQGMSQEKLAEKAKISRSHLSSIEAPNIVRPLFPRSIIQHRRRFGSPSGGPAERHLASDKMRTASCQRQDAVSLSILPLHRRGHG